MDLHEIDISVIMLAYNHEKYIKKALDSVLFQKFNGNIEIIVSDDCSTDHTRDILMEYASRYPTTIIPLLHQDNMGGTKSFYSALSKAKGKYIALLECDDFWIDNNKLQTQFDYLELHQNIIAVYHKIIIVDQNDNITDKNYEVFNKSMFTLHDYERGKLPSQTASLMCRNFFSTQIDNYNVLYKAHNLIGDRTLLLLLLERGEICILPKRMSAYRKIVSTQGENACSLQEKYNMLLEQWKYYNILNEYTKKKNINIDLQYLEQLTFIQAVNRAVKSKKKEDFIIAKKILDCAESKREYLLFLTKIFKEQIKRRIVGKKTTADMLYFKRKNK